MYMICDMIKSMVMMIQKCPKMLMIIERNITHIYPCLSLMSVFKLFDPNDIVK